MKKLNGASILSVVFVLGILVMLNAIGIRYFLRADLTSSKMYSLSKASKNAAKAMDEKLTIKAYFSPGLPAPMNTVGPYVRDMLEDYRAYSKGRIQYEFVNPGDEEQLAQEAESFGIPPRQVQSVEKDKVEVKTAYMGLVFLCGDKRQVIPVVDNVANLEYEITSTIRRLNTKTNPYLGVATTVGPNRPIATQAMYEALARNYKVQMVNLDTPIDMGNVALFVVAPRMPFTDRQLYNIDQYIMKGGKVAIFANSYQVFDQNGRSIGVNVPLNLNRLLNSYGLGLNDDIAIDVRCNAIQVPRQQGFIKYVETVQIPFAPYVQTFNPSHVIARDLRQTVTFYPSTVDTTLAAKKGYAAQGLLYTSDFSGRRTGPMIAIQPLNTMEKTEFIQKHLPLGAVVTGKFTSAFVQSGPPADSTGVPAGEFVRECSAPNRLILVGDGNVLIDEYMQGPQQLLLAENAADWLVQTEDLIDIRSKVVPASPLKDIGDMPRNLIKWGNFCLPVILLIALGVGLWRFRVTRKKAILAQYWTEVKKSHEE